MDSFDVFMVESKICRMIDFVLEQLRWGMILAFGCPIPKNPATYNAHGFVRDEVRGLDLIVTLHQEIALQSPSLDR